MSSPLSWLCGRQAWGRGRRPRFFAYALYSGDPSNGSATGVASFREGRIGYRR
jgi:hypothetical protein